MAKTRSEANFTNSLTPAAVGRTKEFGWDFFKAGIILVDGSGDYLLVKEAKVKETQPDGSIRWVLSDEGKWNLPCGRLGPWEDFYCAAVREGGQETGFDFDTGCIRHIGFRFDIDNPYLIVIYHAENPYDISITDPPNPEEIAAVRWFTYEEILELDRKGLLRNPELTLGAVENERANIAIPEEAITVYSSRYVR